MTSSSSTTSSSTSSSTGDMRLSCLVHELRKRETLEEKQPTQDLSVTYAGRTFRVVNYTRAKITSLENDGAMPCVKIQAKPQGHRGEEHWEVPSFIFESTFPKNSEYLILGSIGQYVIKPYDSEDEDEIRQYKEDERRQYKTITCFTTSHSNDAVTKAKWIPILSEAWTRIDRPEKRFSGKFETATEPLFTLPNQVSDLIAISESEFTKLATFSRMYTTASNLSFVMIDLNDFCSQLPPGNARESMRDNFLSQVVDENGTPIKKERFAAMSQLFLYSFDNKKYYLLTATDAQCNSLGERKVFFQHAAERFDSMQYGVKTEAGGAQIIATKRSNGAPNNESDKTLQFMKKAPQANFRAFIKKLFLGEISVVFQGKPAVKQLYQAEEKAGTFTEGQESVVARTDTALYVDNAYGYCEKLEGRRANPAKDEVEYALHYLEDLPVEYSFEKVRIRTFTRPIEKEASSSLLVGDDSNPERIRLDKIPLYSYENTFSFDFARIFGIVPGVVTKTQLCFAQCLSLFQAAEGQQIKSDDLAAIVTGYYDDSNSDPNKSEKDKKWGEMVHLLPYDGRNYPFRFPIT